jgi:DNA-binding transcriptional regulator YbjK
MDKVIYSASCPPSCIVSMDEVIYSAPATVPVALSYLSDQDSYSKLMASLHERHLTKTKNLLQQKWQQQQQQQQQQQWRREPPPAAASCYSLV